MLVFFVQDKTATALKAMGPGSWRALAIGAALAGCTPTFGIDGVGEQAVSQGLGNDEDAAGLSPEVSGLLAKARKSMIGGQVDPRLLDEIKNSDDPRYARAGRLLRTMEEHYEQVEAVTDPSNSEPSAPTTAPKVRASDSHSGTLGGEGEHGSGLNRVSSDQQAGPTGVLPFVTKVSLDADGRGVKLHLRASSSVKLGMVSQPDSGVVRFLAARTGALPAALSARPALRGLKVTNIRRGSGALHVGVEMPQGWTVGEPVSSSSGATVQFFPPGK